MEENKKKDIEFLNPFQKEVHETLEGLMDKTAEGAERGYLVISYERTDKEIQCNANYHGDPNLISAAVFGLLCEATSPAANIIHRAVESLLSQIGIKQKVEGAQESATENTESHE